MNGPRYVLLSETTAVSDFVLDSLFTDVTKNGEVYTTYRIVRITHEIVDHPDNWTHLANIAPLEEVGIGVAYLRIKNLVVEDSRIKPPTSETL